MNSDIFSGFNNRLVWLNEVEFHSIPNEFEGFVRATLAEVSILINFN